MASQDGYTKTNREKKKEEKKECVSNIPTKKDYVNFLEDVKKREKDSYECARKMSNETFSLLQEVALKEYQNVLALIRMETLIHQIITDEPLTETFTKVARVRDKIMTILDDEDDLNSFIFSIALLSLAHDLTESSANFVAFGQSLVEKRYEPEVA